jgi:hypothetical protein
MVRRISIVVLSGIVLGLLFLLAYAWMSPRLVQISPAPGMSEVPAAEPLRLSFSRPMQSGSVEARLSVTRQAGPGVPVSGAYTWQGSTLVFTPSQPWPAGETIQVRLQPGSVAAGWLSLPLRTTEQSWSFTARQPRLLYLFPADGMANLYEANPATGETRPLTNEFGGLLDFVVLPDGSQVYYSLRREDTQGSSLPGSTIYRLSLEQNLNQPAATGTPVAFAAPEKVLDCSQAVCRALAVSSGGEYLAYERSTLPGSDQPDKPQVWVLPIKSESAAAPALIGAADHTTLLPAWSAPLKSYPAGVLAYYDQTAAAYIFADPRGIELARFPNQTGQAGSWRSDGLAFVAPEISFLDANVAANLSNLDRLADSHLIEYDWQTQKTRDLTQVEGLEDTAPDFSPDGNLLAFARKSVDPKQWTPGRQAWVMHSATLASQQLTNNPDYNFFDFTWSPASDRLAFARFNQTAPTEAPEVWMIDLLNGQAFRLVVGGYTPQWIP